MLEKSGTSNLFFSLIFPIKFEKEVAKYCYMWKESGQYSKKDLNLN